jgi:hypothetical protein
MVSAKNTLATGFRLTVLTFPAKETLNDVFDAQWPLCIRALISRWISKIEIHRIHQEKNPAPGGRALRLGDFPAPRTTGASGKIGLRP